MSASVDDVHHRDGKHLGVRAAQVFEEGKIELDGGGLRHGQGNTQDGVGPQAGLVGRAVQVDHDFVNGRLEGGIVPGDFRRDDLVDVFHGLENALAAVALGVPVPELPGFMLPGGGSAGDGCASDGSAGQGHVHFHGGIAPRIDNFTAADVDDFQFVHDHKIFYCLFWTMERLFSFQGTTS